MKITVRVIPKSSQQKVVKKDGVFCVYVKSLPEKGKANAELRKVLAKHFGTSQSSVKIIVGDRTKNKLVQILNE